MGMKIQAAQVADDELVVRRLIEHAEKYPNLVFAVLDGAMGIGMPQRLEARDIPQLAEVADIAVYGGAKELLHRVEFDSQGEARNFELDEAAAAEVFHL